MNDEKFQLKPYLPVRRIGQSIWVGNLPPNGVEIEDAPAGLDALFGVLSSPTTLTDIGKIMHGTDGIMSEGWIDVVKQLIDSGIVGTPAKAEGRYARHQLYFDMIGLDPVGAQAQLSKATVAVVGTGGIGSNVATILAAAGVGNIILADGDTVELSNLTRQFLYAESSVGNLKVDEAAKRLKQINSEVGITTIPENATREMFIDTLKASDVIVLSADNPDELHQWIDEGARVNNYAYLAAGYIEGHGSIGPTVIPGVTACYDCMIRQGEHSPSNKAVEMSGNLNLNHQAASYGPLNMTVASIAANETIRLLLGASATTAGNRMLIDSQSYQSHLEKFDKLDDCKSCG